MKRFLSLFLTVIFVMTLIPTSVFAAKEETLSQLELSAVAPVAGAKPDYTKIDGRGYYSDNGSIGPSTAIYKNGIAWYKSASSYISPGTSETFAGGSTYTLKIHLVAKGNFSFASNMTVTVNGRPATVELFDDGSVTVSVNMIATQTISSADLSVTAPADGAKPSYTKIDGNGYFSENGILGVSTALYKNGIAWYKSTSSHFSSGTSETFVGGTSYTLKVHLVAKEGYQFASSFTAKINGKTATVEMLDDGSVLLSAVLTAPEKVHTHSAGSTWEADDSHHWHVCTDKSCGAIVGGKQVHTDNNKDYACDVCGGRIPVSNPDTPVESPAPDETPNETPDETPNETPDAPETEDVPAQDNDLKEGDNGIFLWIIIAVVIVAAGGAAAFFLLKNKKKDA